MNLTSVHVLCSIRYENTGAGSSLLCFASDTCDDPQWTVDSDDLTSGLPSCTGIQDVVSQTNITNNNTDEDCASRHMTHHMTHHVTQQTDH